MRRQFTILIFVIFSYLSLPLNLTAQQSQLKIIDAETSEACAFANIILYDLDNNYLGGFVANDEGIVLLNITGKTKIEVSFVGYQKYTDFINPGDNKTIKLEVDFLGVEEVVVTGQYEPKKADQSIYKIDVINSKTLQERGVTNLAEALSNETSIRLAIDPSTGTSIELQGMGGENVKFLIDGVPLVGRVNGDIDLSQINMENVDHIEIVQGPMSVVYGTNALAGVINIITKQNTKDKNVAKANIYADTKNNYNVGLYTSIMRNKHTVTLSANRDMFQGVDVNLNVDSTRFPSGKDRYMEFKPKRVFNADFEYVYRNKYFQLRAKSQYMDLLLKSYNNPTPVLISYDADYNTMRSTNSVSISDKINDALSYNIVGAYTYYGRNTYYISSDLVSLDNETTGSSFTLFQNGMTRGSFIYDINKSKFSLQFGWDINYDKGEGDKIVDGAEMGDYAAFVSAQYMPLKQLSIQPGFRYIYNSIYQAPLIPSINLQWVILKGLNFRLSFAKGFRAPSLKELYLDFKDSNHNLEGNKDLEAEKTNSYNASISYKIGKNKHLFKIEPSVFYNDGKDAITLLVTDPENNSATNTNLGGRRTQGGNINVSYRHFIGLLLGAGFSITGETYDYIGNGEYTPIIYYNNYSFNAKYNWRKYKIVFMTNLKYYDKTPSLAVDENTGDYYQVYTESYGDLEATVSKTFWKNRLILIAGGKNLLDNYERRTYGYRGDSEDYLGPRYYGRTYFIKLNVILNN